MLEKFKAAGYAAVPFDGPAGAYVLNTCTVTGTGDKKSMQLRPGGCEAAEAQQRIGAVRPSWGIRRTGAELLSTGARLILGTQRRAEVVELLEQAVREGKQICAVEALTQAPFESLDHYRAGGAHPRHSENSGGLQ